MGVRFRLAFQCIGSSGVFVVIATLPAPGCQGALRKGCVWGSQNPRMGRGSAVGGPFPLLCAPQGKGLADLQMTFEWKKWKCGVQCSQCLYDFLLCVCVGGGGGHSFGRHYNTCPRPVCGFKFSLQTNQSCWGARFLMTLMRVILLCPPTCVHEGREKADAHLPTRLLLLSPPCVSLTCSCSAEDQPSARPPGPLCP